jgi:hypothetical protein
VQEKYIQMIDLEAVKATDATEGLNSHGNASLQRAAITALSGKPARPPVAALQRTHISGPKSNTAQPCLLRIVSLRRSVGTLSYMIAIEVSVQSPIV